MMNPQGHLEPDSEPPPTIPSSRDLQSYLSDLSIFMANKSKKIYILVDNRPWLNPGTRSAHFWKLMVTKLHKTLYCFIVFEVEWENVRGINYLNELQTDTSLAIEAKLMRRWEFESSCTRHCTVSSCLKLSGTIQTPLLLLKLS
ncbi:hypothetical protein Bca101_031829 [Brassica carinata]|uniref:Uncharacterized protein n=2 Tax=Brassica TaxID=3705 RepID=A0A0D3EA35_BRAOL